MAEQKSQPGKKLKNGEKTRGKRASGRKSANEPPFWSANLSGDHPYKPARPTHSLLGSSPMIPALLLLVVLMLLPSSVWFRQSVQSAVNLPVVTQISALMQKKQPLVPKAKVWANRQSGFYYCRGDVLFGTKQGRLMTQGDALMSGYQPADNHYCTSKKATGVSHRSASLLGTIGIE